jgi:hypothetical protein
MIKKLRNKFFILMSLLLICTSTLCLTACSSDDDDDDTRSNYAALFSKTDYFIDMLDVIYERYDAFGLRAEDTSDGNFRVTPMGRLIIVKKISYYSDITYTDIKEALESHYRKNSKVKEVYINNGGTVTIDCRY